MRLQTRLITIISSTILLMIVAGCTLSGDSCPSSTPVDLSTDEQYAEDESLPFRFPLDGHWTNFITNAAMFATHGRTTRGPEYHAAEDLHRPAGTPVYAMADGQIRFSGPMGGMAG
jgi:murein DD-endopeptidase MepM/ murein hydrolase activator NlpD